MYISRQADNSSLSVSFNISCFCILENSEQNGACVLVEKLI